MLAAPAAQPADQETPLSGQDRSFLAWESRTRPMHFGAVAVFRVPAGRAQPTLEAILGALAPLCAEPRFRERLVRRGWTRRPRWTAVPSFRMEDHVHGYAPPPSENPDALRRLVDEILERPLDRARPLWEVWLLGGQPDASAFTLVFKVHHALLDGVAAVALLARVLGTTPHARPRRAPLSPRSVASARRASPRLRPLLRLVGAFLRGTPSTPLNGRVGTARHHRWLSVDATAFDAGAARLAGTRNDAALAATAGAVARWLPVGTALGGAVRAFCPVSLRRRDEAGVLGNHISLWIVELPLDEPDLRARMARITRATAGHKRRRDAAGGALLARLVETWGAWIAWLGMAVAGHRRAYNLVVTNVVGPTRPVCLLGAELETIAPFAPLFPGQRVAVAVVSYAGRLHVGVNDGWSEPGDGDRFAAALERGLGEIAAHAAIVRLTHRSRGVQPCSVRVVPEAARLAGPAPERPMSDLLELEGRS